MAKKYCANCERYVNTSRKIGVGTFIMVICTVGLWLLVIPFYEQRCPICLSKNVPFSRSSLLDTAPKDKSSEPLQGKPGSKETKNCPYCAEEVLAAAIKCKHCGSELGDAGAVQSG
jgi:hypothetical protein